jgi:hypothetical protein
LLVGPDEFLHSQDGIAIGPEGGHTRSLLEGNAKLEKLEQFSLVL